jgi:hypothetical protein
MSIPHVWWVVLFVVAALGVGLILVIVGTIRKNRWGINLEAVNCPHCKQLIPQVRKPRSMSQAMLGRRNVRTMRL